MIFVDFISTLYVLSWAEKEIFKWFEAAADCKVTRADSGLAHAQSCKSLKCIAHNFLVPALLGSRAPLGWMSSQRVSSWVWCSFCLQGKWGLPLPRGGERYGLPQGHQPPDFTVAFPSCSSRDLVFPPSRKMPGTLFRVGSPCSSSCFLDGQTHRAKVSEGLRALCFRVSPGNLRWSLPGRREKLFISPWNCLEEIFIVLVTLVIK